MLFNRRPGRYVLIVFGLQSLEVGEGVDDVDSAAPLCVFKGHEVIRWNRLLHRYVVGARGRLNCLVLGWHLRILVDVRVWQRLGGDGALTVKQHADEVLHALLDTRIIDRRQVGSLLFDRVLDYLKLLG